LFLQRKETKNIAQLLFALTTILHLNVLMGCQYYVTFIYK